MARKLHDFILKRSVPTMLLGCAGFLYLKTFSLPFAPIYQGDNAPVFLMEAQRMLNGQRIYRDFFELTFPGTQTLYLALFKIFGVRAWIPAAVMVSVGAVLAWLGILISRRVVNGLLALLPSLLYVSLAVGSALDPTHHWFSILAALAALALILDERSFGRLLGAGALCGVATFFTQSRGAMAWLAFAGFLLWEASAKKLGWRWLAEKLTALVAGYLAIALPLVAYFVWRAGPQRFLFDTFTFITRYYSYFERNNPGVYMVDVPTFEGWLEAPALAIWLFVHMLVPLVCLLFLARYWRERRARPHERWDQLMLINFLGLAFFLSIASAPNWFKVASATLPALVTLAWFLNSPGKLQMLARRLLWCTGLAVAILTPIITQTDWHGELNTAAGRVAFLEPDRFEKFQWFSTRTRPGEFLLEAGDTDLYFPLSLQDPSPVAFLTPTDYTRPRQVQETLSGLESHRVRYVLWSPWLDLPEEGRFEGDHLGPIRGYLHQSYHVVKAFGDGDQVWERK